MTFQEVCEAFIRKHRPDITDENEVRRLGLEFFNADPTGGLGHVFAAADDLQPVPRASGLVELPAVAVIGARREYECGFHEGVVFKSGDRVVYRCPPGHACRVLCLYTSDGWVLAGIFPQQLAPVTEAPALTPPGLADLTARIEKLEGRFETEPFVEFDGEIPVRAAGEVPLPVYAVRVRGELQVFVAGVRAEPKELRRARPSPR